MIPPAPTPSKRSNELRLELRGRFIDKVRIAQTFQSAYRVLDRLCEAEVRQFEVVYHEDFEVEDALMTEFTRAAQEALAYKDALSFGRDIHTRIVGIDGIADEATREMATNLHRK